MKKDSYRFIIQGVPVIQQRPRKGRYGNFYDPSKKERDALSLALTYERMKQKMPLAKGKITLYLEFFGCGNRCDLSNLIKAFEDSANETLWVDDRQVERIFAYMKRKDDAPRTEATIVDSQYFEDHDVSESKAIL